MSEGDAVSVLLQVVGPDPRGDDFWTTYKKRVKVEKSESVAAEKPREVPEAPEVPEASEVPAPKRRRLKPALPAPPVDNQLGDPDLYPSDDDGERTLPMLEPELDPTENQEVDDTQLDGEPLEEGEEEYPEDDIEMEVAPNNGGDDQDSPNSGAAYPS